MGDLVLDGIVCVVDSKNFVRVSDSYSFESVCHNVLILCRSNWTLQSLDRSTKHNGQQQCSA